MLQALLQNQNVFPKWGKCSHVGIFLCHSPHHAASVPLILSTQRGLVSPQFHCVFNDDFDTVKKEQHDTSIWQRKAHRQATQDKCRAATVNVMPVTQPTLTKTLLLPNYGADIPATLQQLPELLEQATMTAETPNATQMEPSIMPDLALQRTGSPDLLKTPNEVQEQPNFPVNIAQELEGKYDHHPTLLMPLIIVAF